MKELIKRLNVISLSESNSNWGIWILFVLSFVDSSVFPLPAQTLFLFLVLMNQKKAFKYIISGILGTLAGALVGYAIGHFAFLNINGGYTGFADFLFNHIPGFSQNEYNNMQSLFLKWNFWILFGASFTPIPYAVFSISSGLFEINMFIFCLTTLFSQAIKFILLAFMAIFFSRIRTILELKLKPYTTLFVVCISLMILVP